MTMKHQVDIVEMRNSFFYVGAKSRCRKNNFDILSSSKMRNLDCPNKN